jgi:hypothetical protein
VASRFTCAHAAPSEAAGPGRRLLRPSEEPEGPGGSTFCFAPARAEGLRGGTAEGLICLQVLQPGSRWTCNQVRRAGAATRERASASKSSRPARRGSDVHSLRWVGSRSSPGAEFTRRGPARARAQRSRPRQSRPASARPRLTPARAGRSERSHSRASRRGGQDQFKLMRARPACPRSALRVLGRESWCRAGGGVVEFTKASG